MVTSRLPHSLRSDAQDNRDLILDAARAVFATKGLNAPVREIARHAGVGPATVYRRFPTKEMLAAEAFADKLRGCQVIIDEGAADPDPWRGFCLVIEKICEQHARDRGFTVAFMAAYPRAVDFAASRDYALSSVAGLARRAREAGRLRPDFVMDDLIVMIMASSGIRATSTAAAVAASRRFAALTIHAFQATPGVSRLRPVRLGLLGRAGDGASIDLDGRGVDTHVLPLDHELEGRWRRERPEPELPLALVGPVAARGFTARLGEQGRVRPVGWTRPAPEGVIDGRGLRAVREADAELQVALGLRELGISPELAFHQALPGRLVERVPPDGQLQGEAAALGEGDDVLQGDDRLLRPGDEPLDRYRIAQGIPRRPQPGSSAHVSYGSR